MKGFRRLTSNITNPRHVFTPGKSGKPRDWTEEMVFRVGLYLVNDKEIRKATEPGVLVRRSNPVGYRAILDRSHPVA